MDLICGDWSLGMPKKYIVYIEQVNQTFVEVTAQNEEEAREKGKAKWRREWAHAKVRSVEKCDDKFQPYA
jgi:hypothetical protein